MHFTTAVSNEMDKRSMSPTERKGHFLESLEKKKSSEVEILLFNQLLW